MCFNPEPTQIGILIQLPRVPASSTTLPSPTPIFLIQSANFFIPASHLSKHPHPRHITPSPYQNTPNYWGLFYPLISSIHRHTSSLYITFILLSPWPVSLPTPANFGLRLPSLEGAALGKRNQWCNGAELLTDPIFKLQTTYFKFSHLLSFLGVVRKHFKHSNDMYLSEIGTYIYTSDLTS